MKRLIGNLALELQPTKLPLWILMKKSSLKKIFGKNARIFWKEPKIFWWFTIFWKTNDFLMWIFLYFDCCLFWLVKLPFSKFWLIILFSSFSNPKTDEAKDELFQDDISTYINSQVTAQVLRRTSLKRKELCISPKRGINPNSYSQNQINRQNRRSEPILEISKSSAPLRDEDMIAHLNRYISAFTIK